MNPDTDLVATILHDALQRSDPAERARHLDEACGRDAALRAQVESLIEAHESAGAFLEQPVVEGSSLLNWDEPPKSPGSDSTVRVEAPNRPGRPELDAASSLPPAQAIPGYTILKELHRGGQGVVYQAVQESTKRKVALKVMLEGPFAGPESKKRFEREIALVGSLRHPGIVPIFDSGMASGQFFYAMEYVRGEPLNDYVQRRKLSVDDTLRLFQKVCDAVDYAHQKGVIHRDLKPSNILVDSRGDPFVLDFGLAKIGGAEAEGAGASMLVSVTGQVMGTLAYMSPEQAAGRPDEVDMRSDVYALGVMLYELLTEKYPYEITASMPDTLRTIQETEPKRPSAIRRRINDEVETIILKALSKDKHRRYNTAGALGEDIDRFLAGKPIEAKRDSALYVLRKTIRRYKAPAAAVLTFSVFVTVALVVTLALWRLAEDRLVDVTKARDEAASAQLQAAEQSERRRRLLYASDMNRVMDAWRTANVGLVVRLLQRHIPARDELDLRSFEWYYLWNLCQESLQCPKLEAHDDAIRHMTWSPKGHFLASSSDDSVIRVWKMDSKAVGATFTPNYDTSRFGAKLDFSSDESALAVAYEHDTVVYVLETATARVLYTVPDATDLVGFLDGKRQIIVIRKGELVIWDLEDSRVLRSLGHTSEDRAFVRAKVSPDGRHIALGCRDGRIELWSINEPQALPAVLMSHSGLVRGIAFSTDGMFLASAGVDRSIVVWDLKRRERLHVFPEADAGTVRTVAFSPDGRTLASGGQDNTVKIWDLQRFGQIRTIIGHASGVFAVAFSPDGQTLASASHDRTIRLWPVAYEGDRNLLQGHERDVYEVSFIDEATLISTSIDRTVRTWDVARRQCTDSFSDAIGREVTATSDGKLLAYAGIEGGINVLRRETKTTEWAIERSRADAWLPIRFSTQGLILAVVYRDDTIHLFDIHSRKRLCVLRGHDVDIQSLAFSPNGEILVSGDDAGVIRLWDLSTQETLRILQGHLGTVWGLAFNSTGDRLASAGDDLTVRIWNTRSAEQIHAMAGHSGHVWNVTFSPDGTRIASASGDRTIRLWDVDTGHELLTLEGHVNQVNSVAFSPDGRTLASGSFDSTIRLWRAADESEVRNAGQWWNR